MKVWKDVEGTIPAEVGDLVARIDSYVLPHGAMLTQNNVDNQPVLAWNKALTDRERRLVRKILRNSIENTLD